MSGIAAAAFDAFNSAGEIPSDVDKLIAIGGLCAFKPFDMAVRPFGKIFGESIRSKGEQRANQTIRLVYQNRCDI